ncbi:MAG TPA: TadE/TadG family type IV pilus assembly protein [Caulobacteraceae bacterium]|nr:TadE/TadG family type IV pilus assembly protein [Caulobacteraceae bacterium]
MEFALIAPVLFLVLFGIVTFGIAINNYIELTDSVRSGGRALAIARASTTGASSTPYSSTVSAIDASAPNLTAGSIGITVTIAPVGGGGASCNTDTACATALSAAEGGTATVTATYPCNLTVMQFNFAPSCTLSASTSDLIE